MRNAKSCRLIPVRGQDREIDRIDKREELMRDIVHALEHADQMKAMPWTMPPLAKAMRPRLRLPIVGAAIVELTNAVSNGVGDK